MFVRVYLFMYTITLLVHRFHPDEKANHHPMSHMPFGWGPRNCVGLRFAMMEAKMAMVCLLRKVKFERSPETEVLTHTHTV